jgi:hypothetical protein
MDSNPLCQFLLRQPSLLPKALEYLGKILKLVSFHFSLAIRKCFACVGLLRTPYLIIINEPPLQDEKAAYEDRYF